jgi:hypothetical protein
MIIRLDGLDNNQRKESENPGNRCAQLAAGFSTADVPHVLWAGVFVLATRALNVSVSFE